MNIITRYLALDWIKTFIFAFTTLFVMAVSADLINSFVRAKYEALQILILTGLKMPELMAKMIPLSSLLASLFSLNKLKERSELIAILATGFSYGSIYFVIFICSCFVFIFQAVNTGYLMPKANKARYQQFTVEDDQSPIRSIEGGKIWTKNNHYFASFEAFDADKNFIKNLSLYFFNEKHKSDKILIAKGARYLNEDWWQLEKVLEISDTAKTDFHKLSSSTNMKIKLIEKPEDLKKFQDDVGALNLISLYQFINRLEASEVNTTPYNILFYDKISLCLICILFALVPLESIFRPNRRNSSFGKNIAFTLIFTIAYYLSYTSMMAFGSSGRIPAPLACLAIPMLFIVYIFFTFYTNQRLKS